MHPTSSGGLQSIPDFCVENDISLSFFYSLQAQGKAPQVVKLGSRSFITPEARKVWREGLNAEAHQQITRDQLERVTGQNNPKVKTAYDSKNFIIVVQSKNGRENTISLSRDQTVSLVNEIDEARKVWQR